MLSGYRYESIDLVETGWHLEQLIRQKGYSVKDIQNLLQLSCPQPVYRWIKGQILPSMNHLYNLAKILEVHMEDILVPKHSVARRTCICKGMLAEGEAVYVLQVCAECAGEGGIAMFHFMIDLENTRSKGLQGAEYLSAEDRVTIFYSQSCMKVENGKLQQIIDAGSILDICRLKNTGKNALDFYITSRIGELFGNGYKGIIAIVSNDKGYRAVQDYWKNCVTPAQKVVIQSDIEQCIMVSDEGSPRRELIRKKLQEVNLETQYECYAEHFKIRQELETCFEDTAYKDLLGQIVNVVKGKKDRRVLYQDTLRQFGRKRGLDIYTRLRNVV